jgi:long-chain fatty acid transport protein
MNHARSFLAGVILFPLATHALSFRILHQDSQASARANAFAATADNPSAVYYNPAGITQLDGHQFQISAYYILFNTDFKSPTGARSDTIDHLQGVMQLYYTYTPKASPISFGLGVYTPYGLGTEWPDGSGFRTLATENKIIYLTLAPVAAWKINDQLSVAAGPSLNYGNADLGVGLTPAAGTRFQFKGEDYALGYNAGIRWQPHQKHAFGLNYRSATTMNLRGHTETSIPSRESSSLEFDFPQTIVAGWSFRPAPAWNFEVNVDWTDWDRVTTTKLKQGSGDIPFVFNWESSFNYQFGLTRYLSKGFSASAGYVYAEKSIPDETYKPNVPDFDYHVFSVGLGRQHEHWRWHATYQIGFAERTVRNSAPSFFGESADGEYEFSSNALVLSLERKF